MSIVQNLRVVPPAATTPDGTFAAPGRSHLEFNVQPGPVTRVLRGGEAPGTWSEYEPKLLAAVLADTLALLDAESQRADAAEREVARLRAMPEQLSWVPRRPTRLGVVDG